MLPLLTVTSRLGTVDLSHSLRQLLAQSPEFCTESQRRHTGTEGQCLATSPSAGECQRSVPRALMKLNKLTTAVKETDLP